MAVCRHNDPQGFLLGPANVNVTLVQLPVSRAQVAERPREGLAVLLTRLCIVDEDGRRASVVRDVTVNRPSTLEDELKKQDNTVGVTPRNEREQLALVVVRLCNVVALEGDPALPHPLAGLRIVPDELQSKRAGVQHEPTVINEAAVSVQSSRSGKTQAAANNRETHHTTLVELNESRPAAVTLRAKLRGAPVVTAWSGHPLVPPLGSLGCDPLSYELLSNSNEILCQEVWSVSRRPVDIPALHLGPVVESWRLFYQLVDDPGFGKSQLAALCSHSLRRDRQTWRRCLGVVLLPLPLAIFNSNLHPAADVPVADFLRASARRGVARCEYGIE